MEILVTQGRKLHFEPVDGCLFPASPGPELGLLVTAVTFLHRIPADNLQRRKRGPSLLTIFRWADASAGLLRVQAFLNRDHLETQRRSRVPPRRSASGAASTPPG